MRLKGSFGVGVSAGDAMGLDDAVRSKGKIQ